MALSSTDRTLAPRHAEFLPAVESDLECAPATGDQDLSAQAEAASAFRWLKPVPHPLRHPWQAFTWGVQLAFGVIVLLALLTVTASVPLLNLLALGYLLDLQREVARSGKLQRALPLLPAALRIGSLALGLMSWLVPLLILAVWVADARLIDPHSADTRVGIGISILSAVAVFVHLAVACARGGKLANFLRPIKNLRKWREPIQSGNYWLTIDRSLQDFLGAVRPWHCLWLGTRGFLGTCVWLALPTALHSAGWYSPSAAARILTLVGGAALVPVLALLPWLQAHLAADNRWSAMFDLPAVHRLFRNSPFCWLLATALLYLSAIPLFLYSLHYRMNIPLRAAVWWDLALISIACTVPARIAVAWAYHRASVRGPAWRGWVWLNRLALAGALAAFVWLLFQTPLTHESHPWQLEHHALVLPIPW